MNRHSRFFVAGLLLAAWCATGWAQRQRDPLTMVEADQLRELAQDPVKRLRLYLQFTQERMAAIEQLRADEGAAAGRGEKVRRLLQDFARLVDGLDANMEMFAEREQALRRPLREIAEAAALWQTKLSSFAESGGAGGGPEEVRDYEFTLEEAMDAVNAAAETAREALAAEDRREQEKRDARKKRKRN
jgi:hypothetical protein